MNKEQRSNTYGKFEAVSVNGVAHAITTPMRAVHHAANLRSHHTGQLQDQTNKRMINADDNLRKIFGGKNQVSMFEMTALVNKHLKA